MAASLAVNTPEYMPPKMITGSSNAQTLSRMTARASLIFGRGRCFIPFLRQNIQAYSDMAIIMRIPGINPVRNSASNESLVIMA